MEGLHTLRSFDLNIERLDKLIQKISRQIQKQYAELYGFLSTGDIQKAHNVIEMDNKVNYLALQIDKRALRILVRHQPLAVDLRMVVSATKLSTFLERMGDGAKAIAKGLLEEKDVPELFGHGTYIAMMDLAMAMLKDGTQAWLDRDGALAVKVRLRDEKMDRLFKSLSRELVSWMMEDARNITKSLNVLMIGRYLERVGDQVSNMCEYIYFSKTGEYLEDIDEGLISRGVAFDLSDHDIQQAEDAFADAEDFDEDGK